MMATHTNLRFQEGCARWLLLLTLVHTVPVLWLTPATAAMAPTVVLLAYGLASLFSFSREGSALGLMALAPALIYSAIAWVIAWVLGKLLMRARHGGPWLLAAVTIAMLSAVYLPIYGSGGHGAWRSSNLPNLFEGAIGWDILLRYWIPLHAVLAALFAGYAVRADHPWLPLARRWARPALVTTGLCGMVAISYQKYDVLFCRPFAELGVERAQLCVARTATRDQRYWYERAADHGDPEALAWLIANTPNRATRLDWLRKGAENDDSASQFALYEFLLHTPGPDAQQEAELWLQRAAEGGSGDARFEMAERISKVVYRTGSEDRLAERTKWLDSAAELGSRGARHRLAQHYTDGGMGYPVDFERARGYYRQLIADHELSGHETRYGLSINGYQQRLAELGAWEKGLEDGDTAMMKAMATRYLRSQHPGPGVRDRGQALMERLAEDGDNDARDALIVSLRTGSGGLTKDTHAARDWLLQAAQSGDTAAMQRVASNYMNGREGFPLDYPESRRWIEVQIAALTGNDDRAAQARLRSLNNDLRYIEKLGARAGGEMLGETELERLGQRTDATSRFEHAMQLFVGHGSSRRAEAIAESNEAANAGHGEAAWQLFQVYEHGFSEEVDPDAAWRSLELAVANHHFDATRELAMSYEYGKRVAVDLPRAIEIYEGALAAGHDNRYGWNLDPGTFNHYKWLESRLRQARMKLDRASGAAAGL